MPRDGAGNYTLAPGNPVAGGTIISTTWANPTMDDLAVAMTDSLSRTGQGGMLVPFLNADGTTLAPGISFSNEPNSGLYRPLVNDVRMSIGGEDTTRWVNATAQTPGEQKPFEIWNGLTWGVPFVLGGNLSLNNDFFLSGRNLLDTANINIVKVNPSDQIEFGTAPITMPGALNVEGGITGDVNGSATTAATVTDPAQPIITSLGTLTGLTVTAPIAGSVTGSAGTAGTVTVAAQPVITSLGTLTDLTVADLSGGGTQNVGADFSGKLVIIAGSGGIPDGDTANPGAFFADAPGTGMMRFGSGPIGWSVGGANRMILGGTQSPLSVDNKGTVNYESVDPLNGDLTIRCTNFTYENTIGQFSVRSINARIDIQSTSGGGLFRGFRFLTGAVGFMGLERGSIIAPDSGTGVDMSFLLGTTPAFNTALVLKNTGNVVQMPSLQGTGVRAVVADAQGNLSAP